MASILLHDSPAKPGSPLRIDVIMSGSASGSTACNLQALCFPREWPAVFGQSSALKALVNAQLKGRRCRAVSLEDRVVEALDAEAVHEIMSTSADSFETSSRLAALPGWQLLTGWAVFESLDEPPGKTFVAIRRWWNATPQSNWVDLASPAAAPSIQWPTSEGAVCAW